MMKTDTFWGWCRSLGVLAGLTAALLLQAACSVIPEPTADPTRYFLLNAPADHPAALPHGTLHLGLRAIELPGYLRNTRSMVVRRGGNEVRFEDFARWAESLDSGIQRVVRDRLLSSENVASADTPPFVGGPKRDFDIVVRVAECGGELAEAGHGTTRFVATYDVYDVSKGGDLVVRRTFVAPEQPWNGTDFSQLASGLAESVSALGSDIAQNLPH